MAQWLGQFTGNTHLTKVKDREQQLRHAIEVMGTKQSPAERHTYMKTVERFAEQLLLARLHALKSHIASVDPRDTKGLEAAQRKVSELEAEGVPGVLSAFEVSADAN